MINELAMSNKYSLIIAGVDELWTKSPPVQKQFLKLLKKDIENRIKAEVELGRGRLFIRPYSREQLEKLRKVFGLSFIAPAETLPTDLRAIISRIKEIAPNLSGTFRITTHRSWKGFPMTSIELNRLLGEEILKVNPNLKVSLKEPETNIHVEIHKDLTYLYWERIRGAGGLPLGSSGRVLMLFSGGIDSPVATWLLAKRGVEPTLLFFNLEVGVPQELLDVHSILKEWIPKLPLYEVNISDIVPLILRKVRPGYRQIVLKILFYRLASEFAKLHNLDVIATGESLGQVSTQTLKSLTILDKVIEEPILRPLLCFDKKEVINLARSIGTLKASEKVKEICALEKRSNPSPNQRIALEEYEKLNLNLKEIVLRGRLLSYTDIKSENSGELKLPETFKLEDFEILHLPEDLDVQPESSKRYLLICKTGTTAKVIAERWRERGIEAYALDEKTAERLLKGSKK